QSPTSNPQILKAEPPREASPNPQILKAEPSREASPNPQILKAEPPREASSNPQHSAPGEKPAPRRTPGVTQKLSNYSQIKALDDLPPAQREALEAFMRRYEEKTRRSKELAQRHKRYYADPRSVTGFSALWKEICYQLASERSKGARIWDVDGNEYLDFVMSYGVALFGHAPDFMQRAVAEQLEKGNSLDVLPPKATEIARIIAEMSGMDRVTLANTGTEAVLGAVRAARTATGREKIAVFDSDYHGMVDQFMVRGVRFGVGLRALPATPGVPRFLVENNLVLDYDDPETLAVLERHIGELAAVVIEPVQAQNPHWQHPELIREIRRLTEKHGVALIFDEIINGFRMHPRGAQAWYGVEADLVAYGKSISGGLPLSAIAGKERFMQAFDGGLWQFGDASRPEATVNYFAGTFIKNPLSVAAAHAAMSELERRSPELQRELNARALRFFERLRRLFLETRAPLLLQGSASFFMLKPADDNPLTRLFQYFLRLEGVNIRERPCFLSTEHSEEDLERALEAFRRAIQNMMDAGLMQPWTGEDLNRIVPPPPHLDGPEPTPEPEAPIQVEDPAEAPLTEGQLEIFLQHQLSPNAARAFNIGTEIRLEGPLNPESLREAVRRVVGRHEALRTTFAPDGSRQR
ncbi:MAG: aminotransferase class III-fold pyridoxal phosphate-dependent enzyme, partial [Bacteroidetes bacterium]